jgi:hypothetical protein
MSHLEAPARATLACVIVAVALAVSVTAAAKWSRADADAFLSKMVQIATHGLIEKKRPAKRTTLLERELNAYIAVHGRSELPAGVVDPVISILPDGRLTGRATVDLDAVRASEERGLLSPWTLLRGQVPVEAIGLLRTQKGVGAFTLESATVGGLPVPKAILQELVTYYSRSESQPQGINIEAPFRLPAEIQEIRTAQGQALVVQ